MKKIIISLFLVLVMQVMPVFSQAPDWYTNPDRNVSYSTSIYLLGTGLGDTFEAAQLSAYADLSSRFNLDIYSSLLDVEAETLSYGEINNYYYRSSTMAATSHVQSLKNVETKERYYDSSSRKYYVLVVVHKRDTANMLVNMISKNNSVVKEYYSLAGREKDNLRKYGLLGKAFLVATKSEKLNELLPYLDYNNSSLITHKDSELMRQEAIDLAYNTTFSLEINYKNGMFKQKLSRIFNDMDMQVVNSSRGASYVVKEQMAYSGTTTAGSYILNYDYRLLLVNAQGKSVMSFDVLGKNIGDNEDDAIRNVNNEISREIERRFKNEFVAFLNKSIL